MRLGVYTDYAYRCEHGIVYGERAFVNFVFELADSVERLVLVGRLDPAPGRSYYPVPEAIEFVGLPYYESLGRPSDAARSLYQSMRTFWRMLEGIDTVWILGPHPHSLAFVAVAALRRRRIALGVRQDFPRYVANRHPGRRSLQLAARLLEATYRLLSRAFPIVVVGAELARMYEGARAVLPITISLVRQEQVLDEPPERSYDGTLRVLSVGRLDREKNPLLMADVLLRLRRDDPRWELVVCGEGPLSGELEQRLQRLGLTDHVQMLGYVPQDCGLVELYRECHALLHVSWTEGVPQVLFEAYAAALPVVATAVGGVAAEAGEAALLIPPGDAEAAALALEHIAGDAALRRRLQQAGTARAHDRTLESQAARVTGFLREHARPPGSFSVPIRTHGGLLGRSWRNGGR